MFLISTCSNDDLQPVEPEAPRKYDIYAFGYVDKVATYWKNGEAVTLGDGINETYAMAGVVSDSDIYAVGTEYVNGANKRSAKCWKNGVEVPLIDNGNESWASDIAVSGSDVFIVGYQTTGGPILIPKYWKNGIPTLIPEGSWAGGATDITVRESDVYMTGWKDEIDSIRASYWINGVAQTVPRTSKYGYYNDIITSGADIYIAGSDYNDKLVQVAKFWENGTETVLTDGTKPANTSSIFISGSDIYIAGDENQTAVYWKNGVVSPLTNSADTHSYTTTISINKGDVIVSGILTDKDYYRLGSCLWINGELQAPFLGTNPTVVVEGIFVVDR